jgi:hypothetical protein
MIEVLVEPRAVDTMSFGVGEFRQERFGFVEFAGCYALIPTAQP